MAAQVFFALDSSLPEALKLVEANDNNDIASITKQISSEIKELKTHRK